MAKQTGPRLTQNSSQVDSFIQELWERFTEYVDSQSAVVGTVTGRDTGKGNVKVHVDGEKAPRKVGMARAKGVEFQTGDRVMLFRNKAGDRMVGFPIASGTGKNAERAVGRDQIIAGAIGNDEVENNVLEGAKLKDNTIGLSKVAPDVRQTIQDSITKKAVDDKLQNYAKSNELKNLATTEQVQSKASQTDFDKLKREVEELKKKVGKGSGGGTKPPKT